MHIRIVSWNVALMPRWLRFLQFDLPSERDHAIAQFLQQTRADIILLQEVFSDSSQTLFQRALADYVCFFDFGNESLRPMHSGLFVASKFALAKSPTFVEFAHGARDDALAAKGVVQVECLLPGQKTLTVLTTHLQARSRMLYQQIRQTQLKQVWDMLDGPGPCVLAGDFNMSDVTEDGFKLNEAQELKRRLGDKVQPVLLGAGSFLVRGAVCEDVSYCHAFTSGCNAVSAKWLPTSLSDHLPLEITVLL